jgi:hypothetical protein
MRLNHEEEITEVKVDILRLIQEMISGIQGISPPEVDVAHVTIQHDQFPLLESFGH